MIKPSDTSEVGGYNTLIVQFKPRNVFPKNGKIVIKFDLSIGLLLDVTDCRDYITQCDQIDASTLSCSQLYSCLSYLGSTQREFHITPFTTRDLSSSDTIIISFKDLEYGPSLKPMMVIIETKPADTVTCDGNLRAYTEEVSDSTMFAPKNPAKFAAGTKLNFEPVAPVYTCGNNKFAWYIIPKVTVDPLSFVQFEFSDGPSLAGTLAYEGITKYSVDTVGRKIVTQTLSTWISGSKIGNSAKINGILLPPISKNFNVIVTTYASGTSVSKENIVHQDSFDVTVKETNPGPSFTVKLSGKTTVSEPGDYSFDISSPCNIINQASYDISFTGPFSIYGCSTNCVSLTLTSFRLTPGTNLGTTLTTIPFKLLNPSSTAPLTNPTFTVSVKDTVANLAAFTSTGTLDTSTKYLSGNSIINTISAGTCYAGDSCTLTYTFTTLHPVCDTCGFKLFGLTKFTQFSNAVIKITVDGVDASPVQPKSSTIDTLTFYPQVSILGSTPIIITVTTVKTPAYSDTFSSFSLNSVDATENDIDKYSGGTKSITTLIKTGSVSYSPTSNTLINYADTDITYTFNSPSFTIPAEESKNYLFVKVPSNFQNCNPKTTYVDYTISDGYKFEISGTPTSSVQIIMGCKNPTSTAPTSPVTFNLKNTNLQPMLTGSTTVQTSIGMALQGPVVAKNTLQCPNCITTMSLQFTRVTGTQIKWIEIKGNLLNKPDPCTVSTVADSCGYKTSSVQVAFSSGVSVQDFTISGIWINNPATVANNPSLTITTYSPDGDPMTYIVDYQSFNADLTLKCSDYCEDCDTSNVCKKCYKDPTGVNEYWLYDVPQYCRTLVDGKCASHYFIDLTKAVNTCSKCNDTCGECKDNMHYCTTCSNPSFRLYKGKCYDGFCPDGSFYNSNTNACEACTSNCATCEGSSNYCKTCLIGYNLISDTHTCESKCPDKYYPASGVCKNCPNECATCTATTTCQSCEDNYFLKINACVDETTCAESGKKFADKSTRKCISCYTDCDTCAVTYDTCTSCKNTDMVLHQGKCSYSCGEGYYKSKDNKCIACANECTRCEGSSTICTACITNYYLQTDSSRCINPCPSDYYVSGSLCIKCDFPCASCVGTSTTCKTCIGTRLLYSETCVEDCPDGTFKDGLKCTKCSSSCANCSGSASSCTSCPSNLILEGDKCLSSCPAGKVIIKGVCENCAEYCETCTIKPENCVKCKGDYYSYAGNCTKTCPEKTLPTTATSTVKSCVDCEIGCDVCQWDDSTNSTFSQKCLKCTKDYKFLNSKCYYICPEGYYVSSDGLLCVKNGELPPVDRNQTNNETAKSNATSSEFVPFPHIISGVILGAFIIAGQSMTSTSTSMIVSSLCVVFSYITLSSYGILAWQAYTVNDLLALIGAGAIALQIILNIFFWIFYCRTISTDNGFISWASNHGCAKAIINLLSTIFTLQTNRLYYCKFFNFETFCVPFVDFLNILSPINGFSMAQLFLTHTPVFIIDIFMLLEYSWGTQLYIAILESLIFSVIMFILLCKEMKSVQENKATLEDDRKNNYAKVNDTSLLNQTQDNPENTKFDPEKLQEAILKRVFEEMGMSSRRSYSHRESLYSPTSTKQRPKRRQSHSDKTEYPKEKDSRKSHSYPSSPKTIKSHEIPLKQYGIEDEKELSPHQLPDNVYSEASPPKENVTPRPMTEFGSQTIPMQKIGAFKEYMKKKDAKRKTKKSNKLFDPDFDASPLPVIQESPDDNEDIFGREQKSQVEFKEDIIEKPDNLTPTPNSKKDGIVREESPELKSIVVVKESLQNGVEETKKPEEKEIIKSPDPIPDNQAKSNKIVPEPPPIENPPQIPQPNIVNPLPQIEEQQKVEVDNSNKNKGLPEIEGFESIPQSLADDDKNGSRAVHSPPQNAKETADEILSKPLNPVDEKDLESAKLGSAVKTKNSNTSVNENKGKSGRKENKKSTKKDANKKKSGKTTERNKKQNESKTMTIPNKVPEVFDDNDGFKYSSANVKAIQKAETLNIPEEKKGENISKPPEEAKNIQKSLIEEQKNPQNDISITTPASQIKVEKAPDDNQTKKTEPQYIGQDEIMGSFERDPAEDCILIHENPEGMLIDLRGRKVNKHGYLVDELGNIVNRKGEIMIPKDEIAQVLGDDNDYPEPVTQENNLFKDEKTDIPSSANPELPNVSQKIPNEDTKEIQNATPIEEFEKSKQKPVEVSKNEDHEYSDRSRKSVSLDSLMGDTPSNYNIQNQRLDDPLDNLKQKSPLGGAVPIPYPPSLPQQQNLIQKPVEYEPPTENDVKMAKIYGGQPRGPAKRPRRANLKNKSANKRDKEQLFKPVENKGGYASDMEEKIENFAAKPLQEISDARLKSEADNIQHPERFMEESKDHVLRTKPQTARSGMRVHNESHHKRAKSRKTTVRENDELEKAYGQNIEDMFLNSDLEDSMASIAPSNISKNSNALLNPKIKEMNDIYLKRLEVPAKHKAKIFKRGKSKGKKLKAKGDSTVNGSGSERDEIASLISENYESMKREFNKQIAGSGVPKQGGFTGQDPFPGPKKL